MAWNSFNPTITPESGALGTFAASGQFYQSADGLVIVKFNVNITTPGTAAGRLFATLPVPFATVGPFAEGGNFYGIQRVAEKGIVGYLKDGTNNMCYLTLYDGSSVFSANSFVRATGIYGAL